MIMNSLNQAEKSNSSTNTISSYFNRVPTSQQPISSSNSQIQTKTLFQTNKLDAKSQRIQFESISAFSKKRKRQNDTTATSPNKKLKTKNPSQWTLDFGQSEETECSECGMVYCKGNLNEEDSHRIFHQSILKPVAIKPMKSMDIVYKDLNDPTVYIFAVAQSSPLFDKQVVTDILKFADRQLAFNGPHKSTNPTEKAYIYVQKAKAVGLIRVERIEKAHRLLDSIQTETGSISRENSDSSLEQSQNNISTSSSNNSTGTIPNPTINDSMVVCAKAEEKAVLGISRVWVWHQARRNGIASTLIDVARSNFIFGDVVPKSQCALTQPTVDGRRFGTSYFGTRQFLVYDQTEMSLSTNGL